MAANDVQDMLIRIDATTERLRQELKRGEQAIDGSTRKIDRELARVDNAFDRVGMSAKRMAIGLVVPMAAAFGVQKLQAYADEWTNISNRLKLVTDSHAELAIAQDDVFAIAQSTRQSLSASAELYQRIAMNAGNLGLSLNEVSGVVKTISQTLAISGSSAQGASAALVQLGQAFASGTLRGEELNSVMEQAPALAQAIAEGMGVSVGELRRLGKEGELTSEQVIAALQKMAGSVEEDFSKTTGTVGQAFEQLGNALVRTIGYFGEATGATNAFARGISNAASTIASFSESELERLRRTREELRATLDTGLQTRGLAPWIIEDLQKQIAGLTGQINALQAARDILANDKSPIGSDDIVDIEAAGAAFARATEGLERFSKASLDAGKAEAARLKSISEQIAALEQEAATVGYTADQLKRYELFLQGATKAELARARAAQEAVRAYEAQLVALEEVQKAANDEYADWEAGHLDRESERFEELVGKSGTAYGEISIHAKRAAENMQDAFADFLFDPFEDGLDGMVVGFAKVLQRMAAEAAAAEIFKAVGTAASSSDYGWVQAIGAALTANAKGNAFASGNVIPFAKGAAFTNQIVDRPTLFPFAKGTGLMGEAGPEAIMPLTRAPDGSLGVRALGGAGGEGGASVINVWVTVDSSGQPAVASDSPGLEQFGAELGRFVDTRYRQLLARDLADGGQIKRAMSGGYR